MVLFLDMDLLGCPLFGQCLCREPPLQCLTSNLLWENLIY